MMYTHKYILRYFLFIIGIGFILAILFQLEDVTSLMDVKEEEKQPNCDITRVMTSIVSNERIFLDRRKHLESICVSRNKTSEMTHKIIGTQDDKLTICLIPKAGCTSWTRIIRFINGDQETVNSPLDIGKFEVHYMPKFERRFDIYNGSERIIIENSLRVLTVRNPYSRIWSAYVDKFVLPDFWIHGRGLIENYRNNASEKSLEYGHDVTFAEFVEYMVPTENEHWTPASTLCDPCLFHPFYIAKQESFSSDLKYILGQLEYNVFSAKRDLVTFETLDQIDYIFHIAARFKDSLEDMKMIFSRLWRAFQYYGYLPDGLDFPQDKFTVWNQTLVTQIIVDEHNKWNISKDASKKQKHSLMVQAYRSLPLSILRKFQQMYKNDFELFQYDSEPADIYNL